MKIRQLNLGDYELIHLQRTSSELFDKAFSKNAEVKLMTVPGGAIMLRRGEVTHEVTTRPGPDRQKLASILARDTARLAWIVQARPMKQPTSVQVKVHTFYDVVHLPDLSVGIDEAVVERASQAMHHINDVKDTARWFEDQCLLPVEGGSKGEVRAFLSTGGSRDPNIRDHFVIHGRSLRLFVQAQTHEDGEGQVYRIQRVARGKGQSRKHPVFLAEGWVGFNDVTEAGRIRAETAAQLDEIGKSDDSFLAMWRRYGEVESRGILDQVHQFGSVRYDSHEVLEDGSVRFDLVESAKLPARLKRLSAGIGMEVYEKAPQFFTMSDLTWTDYEEIRREERLDPLMLGKVRKAADAHAASITLQPEDEPPPLPSEGAIVVSVLGDRTRLDRRQKAQEAISGAICGIPNLGKLLEGHDADKGTFGMAEALTARVRGRVFPGGQQPTPRQQQAIAAILNTPDIVLIQGPPGTGKTTVIEAAVERLNEMIDDPSASSGQILISGFQHDAVENAIQRIEVNDLPSIKFGKKMGREYLDEEERRIDRWRRQKAEHIRAQLPDVRKTELHRQLSMLVEAYVLAPGSLAPTIEQLRRVVSLVGGEVNASVIDQLARVADDLEQELVQARRSDPEQQERVRVIRAIRCQAISFADDGPSNAHLALVRLGPVGLLDKPTCALLNSAARWTEPSAPPFLRDLARLRHRLLLKVIPSGLAEPFRARLRSDVMRVLSDARDAIERQARRSLSGPDAAQNDYLYELENHPGAVRRAIISYTPVFGSTCQQAAGKWVRDVVGDDHQDYDSVLVDEAARANPLDLFIPMTLARRRIALIGDHHQLPHLVDQRLERELEQAYGDERSAREQVTDAIRTSLFQRLYEYFDRDKDPLRVRTVMLNEQFRMHPVLGDFVSHEFYDGDLKSYAFDPEHFWHALPGLEGCAAAWLKVPGTSGQEKPGYSKSRGVEADALATLLKELMDSDEGRHLSFGVITFYRAQVDLLHEALTREGLMVRHSGDHYEVAADYRELRDSANRLSHKLRLRVGTVDAFQGREFDVVLLSMVRSNDYDDTTEQDRRKKYGHLMSPNRLCVAMSRQKKLLIVVGDPQMLDTETALEAIGPLVRFRNELCEREHGKVL